MMAVLCRPPQHAALRAALGERGQDELQGTARGERPVGKVPVVARTHAEHAQAIEHTAQHQRAWADAGPDRGETAQMDQHEGYRRRIDDIGVLGTSAGAWCARRHRNGRDRQSIPQLGP